MKILLAILLFPFACSAQSIPLKAGTFIMQEQTNGYIMRGVDIQETLHDVLQLSFSCIDLGHTCTDLSANLTTVYPFIGTTLTSQKVNLITPANDAITWTGSPTANDGSISFNGSTQYGNITPLSSTAIPTGTVALSMTVFFKFSSNTAGHIFGIGDDLANGNRISLRYSGSQLLADGFNTASQFNWTYDANWHMLTITKVAGAGGGFIKMYLDGTLMVTSTSNPATVINISSSGDFSLARRPGSALPPTFNGTIKFPAIWGRQLSGAEALQLWTNFKYLVGL